MAEPIPPRLRVLVTNDDGVHAAGLHHLVAAMVHAGHDVVVAAPQIDMSGSGAAIGRLHPDEHIDVTTHPIPGVDGLEAFAVDGPPALAVLTARLGAFGDPPDVVVAGINPGHNTGRATMHSGTVGAALTAANFGAKGVAVSLGVSDDPHWGTAAAVAAAAVDWIVDAPERTVLNLNVPDLPLEQLAGVRWAELAAFGTVRAAVVGAEDGRLQMELRETGEVLPPNSDTALVLAGYVAVTALRGISADPEAATAPAPAVAALDAWLLRRSA